MTDISDPTKLIERLPTPEEVEQIMLQKEAETQKALDGRAQMFALYMPRFKGQLNFMSKKQLLLLATDLCKSEYTQDSDINLCIRSANNLNLNSIRRTIGNAIEAPLNEEELKTFSKGEKKFFESLSNLLSQKYDNAIIAITSKEAPEGQMPRTVDEVVKYLPEKKSFDKRLQVEKDAFATGNQIMLTKTLMMHHTLLEYLNSEEGKVSMKKEDAQNVPLTDEQITKINESNAQLTGEALEEYKKKQYDAAKQGNQQ